jgi:hypothetical protein
MFIPNMKLVSYILLWAMLFTGLHRFVETMESQCRHADAAAIMDCCDSRHDCEKKSTGKEHEHRCPPGCDCICCFHIVAISYQFTSDTRPAPKVMHYGSLTSFYQFDYREAFFHPPRFS